MDEIEAALNSCSGLIETTPVQAKQLAELARRLKDRLTDTQINLRPVAARLAGLLLSKVDKGSQASFGKIILAPLINEAMNDIKKPMRDASLGAIRLGIAASSLDGGGINELALEALVNALVAEVNEAAVRVRANIIRGITTTALCTQPAGHLFAGGRIARRFAVTSFCCRQLTESRQHRCGSWATTRRAVRRCPHRVLDIFKVGNKICRVVIVRRIGRAWCY